MRGVRRSRFPLLDRAELVSSAGSRCHWCRRSGGALDPDRQVWHLEHRVTDAERDPDIGTVVLACARCLRDGAADAPLDPVGLTDDPEADAAAEKLLSARRASARRAREASTDPDGEAVADDEEEAEEGDEDSPLGDATPTPARSRTSAPPDGGEPGETSDALDEAEPGDGLDRGDGPESSDQPGAPDEGDASVAAKAGPKAVLDDIRDWIDEDDEAYEDDEDELPGDEAAALRRVYRRRRLLVGGFLFVVVVAVVLVLTGVVFKDSTTKVARAQPPAKLGRFVLLNANVSGPEADQLRQGLAAKGLGDIVLALYGQPGGQGGGGDPGFLLEAGRAGARADFRRGIRGVDGPGAKPFEQSVSGAAYSCGTLDGPPPQTTCVWQSGGSVVIGVGLNIDAAEAVTLTSSATARLQAGP